MGEKARGEGRSENGEKRYISVNESVAESYLIPIVVACSDTSEMTVSDGSESNEHSSRKGDGEERKRDGEERVGGVMREGRHTKVGVNRRF